MPLEAPVIKTERLELDRDSVISLVASRAETVGRTGAAVLGTPASHSLAPGTKRAWLELGAHQSNHFSFRQAELELDGLERGAIFPGHFYNSRYLADSKIQLAIGPEGQR